jgi:predicted phage-related endonuclease
MGMSVTAIHPLVTPAAVSFGDPEPGSSDWIAVRRAGITGTDVAKILGYSKHGNARTVWHDKHGELPEEEAGEAAELGTELEPSVARVWARRRGWDVPEYGLPDLIGRGGILANATEPWQRAQVDYLPLICPDGGGRCGLEVKTRNQFVASRWHRDIPDDVLAQVAWQRIVTGLDHIHVACLIGGQHLVDYRYDPDGELESYVLQAAGVAWHDVQHGLPPAGGENEALVRALDRMHGHRAEAAEMGDGDAEHLGALWAHRKATKAEADRADAAFKVALIDFLQGADLATWNGEVVWSYKPSTRRSISLTTVEETDAEMYDALKAAGFVTTTTSRRVSGPKD